MVKGRGFWWVYHLERDGNPILAPDGAAYKRFPPPDKQTKNYIPLQVEGNEGDQILCQTISQKI